MFYVPGYVEFTLKRLEENGYSAYLVGGCVRDFLMSKIACDYDVTTDALPSEILSCFADVKTLDVGIKHGTVALVFDNNVVEVTTFRLDGEYKDNRRPERVEFTDKIELDLSRRDFTVNAIAYSKTKGFADPFSGMKDIERKRLVCVGNPEERFSEDALRIMRALRFSSVLDFEIEDNTKKAIFNKAKLLCNISLERINVELCKMLSGKNVGNVYLEYADVFSTFIPEMRYVDRETTERISKGLDKAQSDRLSALCVFFSFLCTENFEKNNAEKILLRLKFSKADKNDIVRVLSFVGDNNHFSETEVKKTVSKLGYELAKTYYNVLMCLDVISQEQLDGILKLVESFEKNNVCLDVSSLKINGNDLINNTCIDKRKFSDVFETLLDEVMEEKLDNNFESLIRRAKDFEN